MSTKSSRVPSIEQLRAAAHVHSVDPTDVDLEAVQDFLATLLPALVEIEQRLPRELPPAGLFLPEAEAT